MKYLPYIHLTFALWTIIWAITLHAKNLRSILIFKIIPFFFGMIIFLGAVKTLNWI